VAPAQSSGVQGNGFVGGPRQVSVQLKSWNSSLRHAALPGQKKLGGAFDRLKDRKSTMSSVAAHGESNRELAPVADTNSELEGVGPVVEQATDAPQRDVSQASEFVQLDEIVTSAGEANELEEIAAIAPKVSRDSFALGDDATFSSQEGHDIPEAAKEEMWLPEEPIETFTGADAPWPAVEPSTDLIFDTPKQEQPAEISSRADQSSVEEAIEPPAEIPTPVLVPQPVFPQINTPVTMPETTQTPTAPVNKAPAPAVAKPQPQPPLPSAAMQTSVQLTFSFEIAAMQLTPSFKMGVLKVRPISKLVTMRLPSPQRAQSPLNLQVAFEIVKIQPVAGALGTMRVVPSQQQRPSMAGMPSFAVAGLQVVPNSETAPVQLTPSQQGRASVFITVPFQISTLEFSPSLEIASVILNSNSKQVVVQLPGAGPGSVEGAPMFEIANLELSEGGEIAMMQLNLLGGPKRA
jgi:hypothetical protein